MRPELPTGTVKFLFTDVEGSTRLLHEPGAARCADSRAEHRRILRNVVSAHGGVEVDPQGDAFFIAFPTPTRRRRMIKIDRYASSMADSGRRERKQARGRTVIGYAVALARFTRTLVAATG